MLMRRMCLVGGTFEVSFLTIEKITFEASKFKIIGEKTTSRQELADAIDVRVFQRITRLSRSAVDLLKKEMNEEFLVMFNDPDCGFGIMSTLLKLESGDRNRQVSVTTKGKFLQTPSTNYIYSMSRKEVRDAACMQIGDTGLIDYMLKLMTSVIVGRYNVYSDIAYFYNNVFLKYLNSKWVEVAVNIAIYTKQFVKEWLFKGELVQLPRQVKISGALCIEASISHWKLLDSSFACFVLDPVITNGAGIDLGSNSPKVGENKFEMCVNSVVSLFPLRVVPFYGLLKSRSHSIEVTEYSCLFLSSVSNGPLMTSKSKIPLMASKTRVL
ncbi:hypothetical protein AgCh_027742 [Apium graveolens]